MLSISTKDGFVFSLVENDGKLRKKDGRGRKNGRNIWVGRKKERKKK
jgi:hypothetical protein